MVKINRVANKETNPKHYLQNLPQSSRSDRKESLKDPARVLKYLDDFKSARDDKELRDEFNYEIDYDRLVGVGTSSAIFLSHSTCSQMPPIEKGQRPLYLPGYDMAVKVIVKKWISSKRPSKTRTGNLKLALALGQSKPENNILKVIDVFTTSERIFIFMQYCAYGNIVSFIRRNGQVSSKLVQKWSSQMATALSFLHRFHIAHRNYKLENVLIDEHFNAKLTGFELSKFCIDPQTKQSVLSVSICGSEPYLAPEMLKESGERAYDPKIADVWAFGVGVFLCSTRRYPFEATSLRALRADQLAEKYLERDAKHRLRSVVRDLLAQIFIIEPNDRPTMEDLIKNNSWLNQTHVVRSRTFAQPREEGKSVNSELPSRAKTKEQSPQSMSQNASSPPKTKISVPVSPVAKLAPMVLNRQQQVKINQPQQKRSRRVVQHGARKQQIGHGGRASPSPPQGSPGSQNISEDSISHSRHPSQFAPIIPLSLPDKNTLPDPSNRPN